MANFQTDFVVGFIGLPSAGKSTLVNSLIGSRILKTGVCRTTKEVHYIGEENIFDRKKTEFHRQTIISDDGVRFSILDLPGVADAENKGTEQNFDEITHAWSVNCNLICWVSNIETAFLTKHEKSEFDKVRKLLKKNSEETGTLYQFAIILSKYNHSDDPSSSLEPKKDKKFFCRKEKADDEITDDGEDTSLIDCYKRVEEAFKEDLLDIKIIKFNAFGRIMYSPKSSSILKSLASKSGGVNNCNTTFNLKWAIEDYHLKSQKTIAKCLINYHLDNLSKEIVRNCSYGHSLNSIGTCYNTGVCGCLNNCNCKGSGGLPHCTFHGVCKYGVEKRDFRTTKCKKDDCKYHKITGYCLFGKSNEDPCQPECPRHRFIRIRKIENSIKSIFEKITNGTVLENLLLFCCRLSQESIDRFDFKTHVKYDGSLWNEFSECLKFEDKLNLGKDLYDSILHGFDDYDPDIYYRLVRMFSADNIFVSRIYFEYLNGKRIFSHFGSSLNPSSLTLDNLDSFYPSIVKHDIDIRMNPTISCFTSWLVKMKEIRTELWEEEEEEKDVDIRMVILLVQRHVIPSIFARIAYEGFA